MKSATPPTPPDPVATAAAQTKSNQDTASFQQGMNLINQVTPLGSLTYDQTGTSPQGAPLYTATTALTPTGQESFDLQQQVGQSLNNLALKGTGQVSNAFDQSQNYGNLPQASGLDLSKLTPMQGVDTSGLPALKPFDSSKLGPAPTANADDYKQAQESLYKQFTSRLDPQYADQQKALETQLINKGISQGSDAWNLALGQFGRSKTDAYQTAQNNAVTGATAVEQGQFGMKQQSYQDAVSNALNDYSSSLSGRQQGMSEKQAQAAATLAQRQEGLGEQQASNANDLTRRQQGITESNYLRELPINEISSLLNGGQVQQPSFTNTPQTQMANTDVAGITQNSFMDAYKNYQTKQASNDALTGAVFSLAGSALGGWATGGFK